jgi:hypothetical protein
METSNAWIDFTITRGPIRGKDRNRIGLILRLQARRDVEEFLSGLAQGRTVAADAVGEGWYNCGPEGAQLEVYDADSPLDPRGYSLDHVGGPLLITRNDNRVRAGLVAPDEMANLAFLRIVGISAEGGVTVGLVGAYSSEYVKRVRNILPGAIKQFLQDYLVPITVNLQVISRSE